MYLLEHESLIFKYYMLAWCFVLCVKQFNLISQLIDLNFKFSYLECSFVFIILNSFVRIKFIKRLQLMGETLRWSYILFKLSHYWWRLVAIGILNRNNMHDISWDWNNVSSWMILRTCDYEICNAIIIP